MKMDMHLHSYYSPISYKRFFPIDALHSPERMLRAAKKKGFDGVALTDHDTMKGIKSAEIAAKKLSMTFIPGCEISTADGHLLAYWLNKVPKPNMSVEETIDELRKQDAIIAAPHPYSIGYWLSLGKKAFSLKIDAIEVFNARSIPVYDLLNLSAAKKTKLPMIAGSDAHASWEIGGAYTEFPGNPKKNFKKSKPVYRHPTLPTDLAPTYLLKFLWKLGLWKP